jgi:hypothetical protein
MDNYETHMSDHMQSIIPISGIVAFVLIGSVLLIYISFPSDNTIDIPQVIDDEPIEVVDNIQDQSDAQPEPTSNIIVDNEIVGTTNLIVIAETLGLSDQQTNSNSYTANFNSGGGGKRSTNTNNDDMPTYTLTLYEGDSLSDGVVTMGQEVKAVATTSNLEIVHVTFRWIAPNAQVEDQTIVQFNSPAEDTYAPDQPGNWMVQADFGNGIVLSENMNVPFLVLPESMIGNIALIGSSLAALGGYYYMTKRYASNPTRTS